MDQARELLTQFSGPMGYFFFYSLVAACGCGFPFNSDITLIAASVLAAAGIFDLKILIILAILAILTGDSITFFVARKFGPKLIEMRPFSWIISKKNFLKAESMIQKRGQKFLFVVRFLPLIRTPLFFAAGSLQVKPAYFYSMNGLATLIYVPTLMFSSRYLSENIDAVINSLKHFQLILLTLSAVFALYSFVKLKKKSSPSQG